MIILFLTRHKEYKNDDKTTMFTYKPCVSLYIILVTSQSIADVKNTLRDATIVTHARTR